MRIIDSIKDLLGISPVSIGQLNTDAVKAQAEKPHKVSALRVTATKNPLDDIEVTQEYILIQKLIESDCPVVFVTGKAGTGKSTLIYYLRLILNKRLVVVAPTGVAALQAKGVTIHSFFQFPPKIIDADDIKRVFDRNLYSKLELLIVDEISMVRGDLIDGIDQFLRKNREIESPFGGVQLLLIGDLFQLPPVVMKKERAVLIEKGYASEYFFSALTLQESEMVPVELTKVFRQESKEFIHLLNKVRIAEDLDNSLKRINSRFTEEYISRAEITLTSTNRLADQKNSKELLALPGQEYIFQGVMKGKFSHAKDKLPSPYLLKLKIGAQVMFTKNDEQKRWINGTLGFVKSLSTNSIRVEITSGRPTATYDVLKVTWGTYRYEYDPDQDKIVSKVVGEYTQYPLMLAWAVTIHKSQGKTLPKTFINMGSGAFAPGQVYVALSRVQSLDDIHLARPIKNSDVMCDPKIKRFYLALDRIRQDSQKGKQAH